MTERLEIHVSFKSNAYIARLGRCRASSTGSAYQAASRVLDKYLYSLCDELVAIVRNGDLKQGTSSNGGLDTMFYATVQRIA